MRRAGWIAALALGLQACAFYADEESKARVGAGERCGPLLAAVCEEGLWCDPDPGMCHGGAYRGTCVATPPMCTRDYRPVCGCDGKTYGNECTRRAEREPKDHDGECTAEGPRQQGDRVRSPVPEGERCGGILGIRCEKGLWCDPDPGMCQTVDLMGTCVAPPRFCAPWDYGPVCGCGGSTYYSECTRRRGREQKDHDGVCTAG